VLSLELMTLGTSNLVCRLIIVSASLGVTEHPQKGLFESDDPCDIFNVCFHCLNQIDTLNECI